MSAVPRHETDLLPCLTITLGTSYLPASSARRPFSSECSTGPSHCWKWGQTFPEHKAHSSIRGRLSSYRKDLVGSNFGQICSCAPSCKSDSASLHPLSVTFGAHRDDKFVHLRWSQLRTKGFSKYYTAGWSFRELSILAHLSLKPSDSTHLR
jgi:hypothetical protein